MLVSILLLSRRLGYGRSQLEWQSTKLPQDQSVNGAALLINEGQGDGEISQEGNNSSLSSKREVSASIFCVDSLCYTVDSPPILQKCTRAKVRLLPTLPSSLEQLELHQSGQYLTIECSGSKRPADDSQPEDEPFYFIRRFPFFVDALELW